MKPSIKVVFVSLCLFVSCLFIMGISLLDRTTDDHALVHVHVQALTPYLVYTTGCKIPQFNPWDDSIKRFVNKGNQLFCEQDFKKPVVYQQGNWLRIDKTAPKQWNVSLDYCGYSTIARRTSSDKKIDLHKMIRFYTDIQISADTEFVKVECFSADKAFYRNFFAFIISKNKNGIQLTNLTNVFNPTYQGKRLSVIMLGVDSVSRLNGIRQLPKTRKYLLDTLGAIDILGYNKVADNTFLNLVPMLSGKYVPELPYDEKKTKEKYFDEYDFVWKKYADLGFRTLFAEDAPEGSIFNYQKAGFKSPPTDYYLRPFSLAIEADQSLWHNGHDCFAGRMETKIILDWLTDFIRISDDPYFALTFISRLSHDYINKLGAADEVYLQFFQTLKDQGHLDTVVLFFFGDHGFRYGDFRDTRIGRMEERLPMMYIYFPEWFKRKYTHITDNLYSNSRVLTTPFDIHETLIDILDMPTSTWETPAVVTSRGLSLFKRIPLERSCEHTTILPHWCACRAQSNVSTETDIIRKVAKLVLSYLNSEIRNLNCAELKLFAIHTAYRTVIDEESKYPVIIDYQITFTTVPGMGKFEATVRHFEAEQRFLIPEDVSRINLYGNQSHCIENFVLKKYCFCT